ncbi:uncharacterized protein K02A2.6-like [Haliotis rufescens]|uniref:uncharacterized protein K02A2.6-like n=1 Tax=Haliotis rufescens TaxID=6454 RepID=UPI00201E90A5|nr:uncharacterized protein K02A2.6-like [Haliotis rufescens]
MPTPPPDLPYQEVGCNLFDFQNRKYLVLVDYFSRYIDTVELNSLTTPATITAVKAIFSSHSIPTKLRSDNGPQFDSREFKDFCKSYGIQHVTSSPHFQSSNGEAERAVQTEKKLLKKFEDKHLAPLDYRTTPFEGINLSPTQLLMSRRPRNTLPAAQELLVPRPLVNMKASPTSLEKQKQTYYYNHKKSDNELRSSKPGDIVRMYPLGNNKTWTTAIVNRHHESPRSYYVTCDNGTYCLNRKHMRKVTESHYQRTAPETDRKAPKDHQQSYIPPQVYVPPSTPPPSDQPKTTRSGRRIIPPKKLDLIIPYPVELSVIITR